MEAAFDAMNGYKKLNHHHMHKRLMISAVLLLTLVIGLLLASLIIHDSADTEQEYQQQLASAVEWIKTVCSVTQNPDSCFTTLSSLNISTIKLDPAEVLLKLTLQFNIKELENITSFVRILYETHPEVALCDCMELLEDALSRLNDSVSMMDGEINPTHLRDIQSWVSAALTDEETCLDGLEETGSTVAYEVKSKMKMSDELLSCSLAIIANILKSFLQKFGRSHVRESGGKPTLDFFKLFNIYVLGYFKFVKLYVT